MKKKMLALMLVGSMTMAALAGCGAQKTETSKPQESKVEESKKEESKADAKVEESKVEESKEEVKDYTGEVLRIGWWGGDARNEQTITIIEEFKKQYPGLTVEVEFAGFGDYFTRLNTQAAGGQMPDVLQMDVSKYYTFASNSQLLKLDEYIADGTLDLSQASDSEVALGQVYDGIYGVATGTNGQCMIYNPAILEKAGVTLNMKPTLSEFQEACRTIYEKTGAKTHMFYQTRAEMFYRSMGGNYYESEGSALGFTEDMLMDVAEIIYDGVETGYFLTPNNQVNPDGNSQMVAEELWLQMGSSNEIVSKEAKTGLELELCELFVADDAVEENPTYLKPAMLWSVAANTKLPELAIEFIDFYTNSTYVYDICKADRGVPINAEIREYLKPTLDAASAKCFEYVDYLSTHSTPYNYYVPEKGAEATACIAELIEKLEYSAIKKEDLEKEVKAAYKSAVDTLNVK